MRRMIQPAVAIGVIALATQAMISAPARPSETTAGWFLLHEGSMAKLAYGLPDSDNIALMLTCSPGDVQAMVYGDVEPMSARLHQTSSGPDPQDPLSGGDAWEMTMPLDDQGLMELARNGHFQVRAEGDLHQISATVRERKLVNDFLGYCTTHHA